MLIVKKEKVGIFYLIYPYEYASEELDIYKFGVHENLTPKNSYKRFNDYKGGSEIIIYYKIKNLYENENKVKDHINNQNLKHIFGNEYFTGNLKEIHDEIYEIIKDDIIEVCDLDYDILNDKFRKINIYFDQNFNTKYLNYIQNKFNEPKVMNDYNYRNSNMRYLINDYKRDLLKNIKEVVVTNNTIQTLNNNTVNENNGFIKDYKLIENIKNNENNCNYLIPIDVKNNTSKKLYENTYYNKNKNVYYCSICESEYGHINNLRRHRLKDTCIKRLKLNLIINQLVI